MTTLRELREENVLSIRDLSALTGIAKSTIVDFESGRVQNPRPSTIRKLAAALNVAPRALQLAIQRRAHLRTMVHEAEEQGLYG